MSAGIENIGFWWLVAFMIASGFTTAGLLSSLHSSVAGDGPDFRLSFDNPLSAFWSAFVCLFAGPVIVLKNAANHWVSGLLPFSVLLFCFALSAMWSFCSGVFVVQLAAMFGLIQV